MLSRVGLGSACNALAYRAGLGRVMRWRIGLGSAYGSLARWTGHSVRCSGSRARTSLCCAFARCMSAGSIVLSSDAVHERWRLLCSVGGPARSCGTSFSRLGPATDRRRPAAVFRCSAAELAAGRRPRPAACGGPGLGSADARACSWAAQALYRYMGSFDPPFKAPKSWPGSATRLCGPSHICAGGPRQLQASCSLRARRIGALAVLGAVRSCRCSQL